MIKTFPSLSIHRPPNIAQDVSSENWAPPQHTSDSQLSGCNCITGRSQRYTLCLSLYLSQIRSFHNSHVFVYILHSPRMFFLCFLNGISSYPLWPGLNMTPSFDQLFSSVLPQYFFSKKASPLPFHFALILSVKCPSPISTIISTRATIFFLRLYLFTF